MVLHGALGGAGPPMLGSRKQTALVRVVRWKFWPPPQLISRLLGEVRSQWSSNPWVTRVSSGRAEPSGLSAKSPTLVSVKTLPPPVQRQLATGVSSLMKGAEIGVLE